MKKLMPVLVVVLVLLLVAMPVVLHFGQRAHNRIELDWATAVPEGAEPGFAFGVGTAALMQHELEGTFGWRPNDIILWGPLVAADNNSSRQEGILQALRETVRVFKDHLTKISSDEYDPNLVEADNLLRNDPEKWAFPSAEDRYEKAVEHLQAYVEGLATDPPTSRPINARNVELMRLIQVWSDLLGSAHSNMLRDDVPWFQIDDVFYRTTGYCQVMALMIPAIHIEYSREIESRPILGTLFGEAEDPLVRCSRLKALIVLNGGDASFMANHRRNLDSYVTEARQKFYSIREELDK